MQSECCSEYKDEEGNICEEHFQSNYIDPKINQNIYVLERLLYNTDGTYINHVWKLDKCLFPLQIDYFIEKNDTNINKKDNKNIIKY